jgi:Fe-Mn family superoxide dismutase
MATATYKARDFHLSGLAGISDKTLEMHFGLYEGYVSETNQLTERLAEMTRAGEAAKNPVYVELTRHLGFEYGGMILHEYYFDNLSPKGKGKPSRELTQAIDRSFGDFETWRTDFAAIGGMRGVGWAVLFRDPNTGQLSNHWITLHEQGMRHPCDGAVV